MSHNSLETQYLQRYYKMSKCLFKIAMHEPMEL